MTVGIVRTTWAGTSGGPGLTQMAIRNTSGDFWVPTDAQAAVNAVRQFWFNVNLYLPNEITLTVQPAVDLYYEVSGELIASEIAPSAPAIVTGADSGVYSMATGVKINWNTGVIRNGRRVRGSTFIVPAGTSTMTNTGTVASAVRGAINGHAATLMSSLGTAGLTLCVWSRPVEGPTPRVGALADVAGAETNEKTAVLRGRRD